MLRRRLAMLLSAILFLASAAAAGDAADPAAAAAREAEADALLYAGLARWNGDRVRALAKAVETLPEATAAQALWLAAGYSDQSEAMWVYAAALSSASPLVRRQGADLMAGLDSPDALGLLLERLAAPDADAELLPHVVAGIAVKPTRRAVRSLMQVMLSPNPKSETVSAAAAQLRRLTRTSVGDKPDAWRDWWRANARQYE